MNVYDVLDYRFAKYGRIIEGYDFSSVTDILKRDTYPKEVEYVASLPALEALPVFQAFQKNFYGNMPAELGYCMGHNESLNGLEYHRGSEVNIAVTNYVVMVGCQQDLEPGFAYDTRKIECFLVHAGMAVEFYATTLHYCACHTHPAGYAHATFLPRGTNTDLEKDFMPRTEEDHFLRAKNKWLLYHPEAAPEAVPGTLYGPNWTMADLETCW